jgi:hypothetical protein
MLRALSRRWMGWRSGWVVLIPVLITVATACPPGFAGPPPLMAPAPTILSVSVTPTVVAGQQITADVVTSRVTPRSGYGDRRGLRLSRRGYLE